MTWNYFSTQKFAFFQLPEENRLSSIEAQAEKYSYKEISNHKTALEDELKHLEYIQTKLAQEWTYFLNLLLVRYYSQHNLTVAANYASRIQKYKDAGKKLPPAPVENMSFPEFVLNRVAIAIVDTILIPTQLSRVRDLLSTVHMTRIYWTFFRLAVFEGLKLLNSAKYLSRIDEFLATVFGSHRPTNVARILELWKPVGELFNVLSVSVPALRFLLNCYFILEATFNPSEQEEKELSWSDRLGNALIDRCPQLMNDIWSGVNMVTNYSKAFRISDLLAAQITIAFLAYDLLQTIRDWYLAKQRYLLKSRQYEIELHELDQTSEAHRLVVQQKIENELNWRAEEASQFYSMGASVFLITGFSLFTHLSASFVPFFAFASCTMGVIMFLTAGEFKTYREKAIRLDMEILNDHPNAEKLKQAEEAFYQARKEFYKSLAANFIPGIALGMVLVCWEAALALAFVYAAYKLYEVYGDYSQSQTPIAGAEEEYEPALGCPG